MAKRSTRKKHPLLMALLEQAAERTKGEAGDRTRKTVGMTVAGIDFEVSLLSKKENLGKSIALFFEQLSSWKDENGIIAFVSNKRIWQLMFFLSEYTDIGNVVNMKDGEALYRLFHQEEALASLYEKITDYQDAINIIEDLLALQVSAYNNMLNYVWMSSLPSSEVSKIILEAMEDNDKMEALTKDFNFGNYIASSMISAREEYQEDADKVSAKIAPSVKESKIIQFPKKNADDLPELTHTIKTKETEE